MSTDHRNRPTNHLLLIYLYSILCVKWASTFIENSTKPNTMANSALDIFSFLLYLIRSYRLIPLSLSPKCNWTTSLHIIRDNFFFLHDKQKRLINTANVYEYGPSRAFISQKKLTFLIYRIRKCCILSGWLWMNTVKNRS